MGKPIWLKYFASREENKLNNKNDTKRKRKKNSLKILQ